MKANIPGIINQTVGFTAGWVGLEDGIVMTMDFLSKEYFDIYMTHSYHADYINQTDIELFDTDSFSVAQYEF